MQLRVTRHTQRLDEVVAFYRNGIGLTEIGGFRDHDGYDGAFLAVPGDGAHLELTSAAGAANRCSSSTSETMGRCGRSRSASASIRPLPPTPTGPSTG